MRVPTPAVTSAPQSGALSRPFVLGFAVGIALCAVFLHTTTTVGRARFEPVADMPLLDPPGSGWRT